MIPRTLFSEEHDMFRDAVQRFIEKEITPYHAQWEKDGQVSREVWLAAGAQGYLCCSVPEEYGGTGADF
ncbi:MAG: acyl-CoA dehydrogenase, partial [Rhodospirillaceae bacterium]|nr:acyl-CoA dehydrogenase [Rhodospirillaceae bacterium]